MSAKSVIDYYEVLGVKQSSSCAEIKKSFRKRAKELHPDVNASNKKSDEAFKLLLTAYEVLSDPKAREEYDRSYIFFKGRGHFDYREFLRKRRDDPVSQAKLVFFDLLHGYEQEALDLYEHLQKRGVFDLSDFLDREDYMDCAFLLAEEYEIRKEHKKAYSLLLSIVRLEFEKPYFRHFIEEVLERLKIIVCIKMLDDEAPDMIISYIQELISFNFSNKDNAFFFKKIAEIYSLLGQNEEAVLNLKRGLSLDGRLGGVKKLKEKIGYGKNS